MACDVAVLRAPAGWRLQSVERVLVPIAGRGRHEVLRARLLASIHRLGAREITLLRVLPAGASARDQKRATASLQRLARNEVAGPVRSLVLTSDDVLGAVTGEAAKADLVVLGLRRVSQRHKMFGDLALRVARDTNCGLIMISSGG